MKLVSFRVLISTVCTAFLFSAAFASKSALKPVKSVKASIVADSTIENPAAMTGIPKQLKLVIGAGGIYAAFLYYGTLQEDVFDFKAADGSMFKAAWFLQAFG